MLKSASLAQLSARVLDVVKPEVNLYDNVFI